MVNENRDEEMGQSVATRVLGPILKSLGGRMNKGARGAGTAQIRDMLEQAGHPLGMYYPEFMGLKTFCFLLFTGLAIVSSFFRCAIDFEPDGCAQRPANVDDGTTVVGGHWNVCRFLRPDLLAAPRLE